MPVALLLVEGHLHSQLLSAVLQGQPAVRIGGSKNGLKPQTRHERDANQIQAGYLRDRDFDHDPPVDQQAVTEDAYHNGQVLGWRWARHEIENDLLDPKLVSEALFIDQPQWCEIVLSSARRIYWYQVARWTVGSVRRNLPPQYELATRPPTIDSTRIQLPDGLELEASRNWATSTINAFARRIDSVTSPEAVLEQFTQKSRLLGAPEQLDIERVLLTFSGKDLLAGLTAADLRTLGAENAGSLRAAMRDWVRDNPKETQNLLPEWDDLVARLRS